METVTVRMYTPADEYGERKAVNFITDASAIMMNENTSLENYVTEINNYITENPSIVVSPTKPAFTCLWGQELSKRIEDNDGNTVFDNTPSGLEKEGQIDMNSGYTAGYDVGYGIGYDNGYNDVINGTQTVTPSPIVPDGMNSYYSTGYRGGYYIGYSYGYADGREKALSNESEEEQSTEEEEQP